MQLLPPLVECNWLSGLQPWGKLLGWQHSFAARGMQPMDNIEQPEGTWETHRYARVLCCSGRAQSVLCESVGVAFIRLEPHCSCLGQDGCVWHCVVKLSHAFTF